MADHVLTDSQLAADAARMLDLLERVWDAGVCDPNPIALTRALDAIETFLHERDQP